MPRLIKGASYAPLSENEVDDWTLAALSARILDPEGIESLKLLRWLIKEKEEEYGKKA